MNCDSKESRKNIKPNHKMNERGVALILVTLILVVSSVLALALITYYQTTALTSEVEAYRMQALYLAESGVNFVYHSLRSGTSPPNPTVNTTAYFEGQTGSYTGTYNVSYALNSPSPGQTTLISTGVTPVNKDRRAERVLRIIIDSSTYKVISWKETTKAR